MANVIDTLTMKITLDNGDFKDKIEDAKDEVEDLDDATEDLDDTIRKATTAGTFFGQVLFKGMELVIGAVRNAINEYDSYIESLRIVHRETGQSIEDYQKWAYAIEYAGGNVNAFTSTFERLSKQIRQAPFTHNSTFLRGLSELGINVHDANGQIKSMSDLLLGLAGRFSRMSEGKALLLGQRLGLDDDTIRLLHEGRDAVQSYLDKTKEEGLIQKQNLELYEKLRKMRVEMKKSWKEFSNTLGNIALPIIIKIGEVWMKFIQFIKDHKDFLVHIAEFVALMFAGANGVGLLTNAFKLLKLAMWGLEIGAFLLVWDDLMTYIEGGDSILGRCIKGFDDLTTSIGNFIAKAERQSKGDWWGLTELDWSLDGILNKLKKIFSVFQFFRNPSQWFKDNITWDNISSLFDMSGIGDRATTVVSPVTNNTTNDFRGSTITTQSTNGYAFLYDINAWAKNSEGTS